MPVSVDRPKPTLAPEFCKGCGRCIDACAHKCIVPGSEVNQSTGLVPVSLVHLETCTGCGLCFDACPEPFGLRPEGAAVVSRPHPTARPIPDTFADLTTSEPLVVKGMYASAIGALVAGCRHFFGYPITPSTEGAELMAKLLPTLNGEFLQAVSEVAAINMMYGAGAAGVRAMTFTSSPGFSLMLEGLSYMIGAQVPGVVVNVMRGGPGLGNIGPAQSDIKLACRGLGHGDTHAIVLAPSTPQEMLDHTMLAFDLSFKYRNPVVVLADGYLGQMTGKVVLPRQTVTPGVPAWAVTGDAAHRLNLISSIFLEAHELEIANQHLFRTYEQIDDAEQRADLFECDDAEFVIVSCNTPARMAKGAVRTLRRRGVKAGLFRPLTLWPFPIRILAPMLDTAQRVIVVEASGTQLEDEMRLAMSHADARHVEIDRVNRLGGMIPSQDEIVERVMSRL